MRQPDVFVLIPVIYRPIRLRRVLQSLKDTAPEIGIVVAIEADDAKCEAVAKEFGAIATKCTRVRGGCSYAWNTALAAAPGTAQGFVLGADDLVFKEGWYEAAQAALESIGGDGLVGFNDLHKADPKCATHYLMTRNHLITVNGGVMTCPHYKTECVDVEACERAQAVNKYIYAENAIVEHVWNGRVPDEYFLNNMRYSDKMRCLLDERRKMGYPNDFEAVLHG